MTITTPYLVEDIAALKAITASNRANNYSIAVAHTDLYPYALGMYSNASWYMFRTADTRAEFGNIIIKPTDISSGAGRWVKVDGPFIYTGGATPPDMIPPFSGIIYQADIGGSDMFWVSVGNTSVNDWRIISNDGLKVAAGDPSYNPAFQGVFHYRDDTNQLFINELTTSSDWYNVITGAAPGGGGGS